MTEFLARLKQRKLVQWALAYMAFWFALLQGIDIVATRFNWPDAIERYFILALAIGFFVTLVLAWYHGERGAQRVGGSELLIIALLLAIGGALIWRFGPAAIHRAPALAAQSAPAAGAIAKSATAASVADRSATAIAAQPIPAKSIAVLPFENLSTDKSNAYFADGMQDLILTKLADIGDLKVISRTSTMKYASHPDDLKTVGQQLGVATILEGSVQKAGNQVLINVQLIDAQTDGHIWAESYTRTLDDIFGVEGEVAQKVADALKAKLSPVQVQAEASVSTRNPQAFDLYLKAEYVATRVIGGTSLDPVAEAHHAEELYRQAIAGDPQFALAYARLSRLQVYMGWWFEQDRAPGLDESGRQNAERALALAPNLAEAHVAMGYFYYRRHHDYAAALAEFEKANQLQPNNADVTAAIAFIQRRKGELKLTLAGLQQAMSLDPRNGQWPWEYAVTLAILRQYPAALAAYDRALTLLPVASGAEAEKLWILAVSGSLADARRILAGIAQRNDSLGTLLLVRFRLAMLEQQPDAALSVLAGSADSIRQIYAHGVIPISLLKGDVLAAKGQRDEARAAFENARSTLRAALAQQPADPNYWSLLGLANAGLGQWNDAIAEGRKAAELSPVSKDAFYGPLYLARLAKIYAQASQTDAAIEQLRALMAMPAGEYISVPLLKLDPVWDPIRKDPRFQALLKKYGQAEPAAAASETAHG